MITAFPHRLVQGALASNNWLVTLGAQSSGTFTLTWNGTPTSAIAYNATAATVLAALQALGGSGWIVNGAAGGPYTVTTPPTPTSALTGSGAALTTPGNFGITTGTYTNGAHPGLIVDTGLFGDMFGSLEFVISVGTVTDGTHTVTVQECATPTGTYTLIDPIVGGVSGSKINGVVAGNTIVPQVLPVLNAANSNSLVAFGAVRTLRYVQLVITTAGATAGGVFSGIAVCNTSTKGPVARA